jgi:hypothetical protein
MDFGRPSFTWKVDAPSLLGPWIPDDCQVEDGDARKIAAFKFPLWPIFQVEPPSQQGADLH